MKRIFINEEKCKGCGLCVHYCPEGYLKLAEKFNSSGYHPVTTDSNKRKKCTSCGFCYLICPDTVIEVYR